MPWHLSKSDPRKVYDERHEPVCVCQTAEQAARIVAAVTGVSQTVVRLKEPAIEPKMVGGMEKFAEGDEVYPGQFITVGERVCEQSISFTDSFEPDQGCCRVAIMAAARKGALKSAAAWECPRCGCEWTPRTAGLFRHWSPVSDVQVFKL